MQTDMSQTLKETASKAPGGPGRGRGKVKPPPPGPGRPKGSQNRVTTTIKAATLEAFERLGGVDWLVRMGEGTTDDRRAFMALLARILPAEINANVSGGIQIQLGWLSGRQIGTVTAQQQARQLQVIDVEVNSDGVNRITDQRTVDLPPPDPGLAGLEAAADPPPPHKTGAGG
jgi:hypothetical protein